MAEYVVELTDKQTTDLRRVRRERVTRCRDCEHCVVIETGEAVCTHFLDPANEDYMCVVGSGFCAWGEPRGREDDD